MKKIVLFVGFVGLCLASPNLQVTEKVIVPAVDDPEIRRAALAAVGADDDDIKRGCKDATLISVLSVTYTGYESEGAKGKKYFLNLYIRKADGTNVQCSTNVKLFDVGGAIGVFPCQCK
ncbi:hypothetical protein CHS0354_012966 [Potamilus streckersoni]|uniref:Uncharacterized protein n=1 Tax=Potamilus streckersoni TaxID=2493646 RepID=A0AAE0SMR7_9BIVA|nr:hypothetical protein CHS0354_012966 [Potamilus streckersoni]